MQIKEYNINSRVPPQRSREGVQIQILAGGAWEMAGPR